MPLPHEQPMSRVGGPIVDRSGSVENSICPRDCSAIDFADDINKHSAPRHPVHAGFLLPARWPSVLWQKRRLLGNELVRRGDLRTQNGILRQDSLVAHCRFSPIAVEPQSTLLQHRPVRARARCCACRMNGGIRLVPAFLAENIFFWSRPGISVVRP